VQISVGGRGHYLNSDSELAVDVLALLKARSFRALVEGAQRSSPERPD